MSAMSWGLLYTAILIDVLVTFYLMRRPISRRSTLTLPSTALVSLRGAPTSRALATRSYPGPAAPGMTGTAVMPQTSNRFKTFCKQHWKKFALVGSAAAVVTFIVYLLAHYRPWHVFAQHYITTTLVVSLIWAIVFWKAAKRMTRRRTRVRSQKPMLFTIVALAPLAIELACLLIVGACMLIGAGWSNFKFGPKMHTFWIDCKWFFNLYWGLKLWTCLDSTSWQLTAQLLHLTRVVLLIIVLWKCVQAILKEIRAIITDIRGVKK